jgi:hypothetical protein
MTNNHSHVMKPQRVTAIDSQRFGDPRDEFGVEVLDKVLQAAKWDIRV